MCREIVDVGIINRIGNRFGAKEHTQHEAVFFARLANNVENILVAALRQKIFQGWIKGGHRHRLTVIGHHFVH